ncbi:GGDEF domain-containing protein [Actinoplanes philippinensis]|uniref:GGDEF domain-containing protein n=1 Tax=Actinoplanes philippinensis TaxID=35752 RepID=UPI00340A5696
MSVEEAYLLVERAQVQHDPAAVERLSRTAAARGWADVVVLLHFARSLAGRAARVDDSAHLDEMLETAASIGNQVLMALAIAARASRAADRRRDAACTPSAASLLVRAVVLLDDEDCSAPVVHRAAALIEVGCVAHELGLWELAMENYTLTEKVLARCTDDRWSATRRRQRLVVALNTTELALDWACALAAVGDWEGAAGRAAEALAEVPVAVGPEWPPPWVEQYRGHRGLLAAFTEGAVEPRGADAAGEAIRAARTGDAERAALLADEATRGVGFFLPSSTRLLMLGLAAQRPGTNPAAMRYGAELALLRWNDRLDRMAGMHEAVAVERRRRDHERLARDIVVDELTGLSNRRGLNAFCASLDDARSEESACAVFMIDVDHFKAINDGFGHEVGDLVLTRLGAILSDQIRPVDLAARLGGDEFIMILCEVQRPVAYARAQQVLDAILTHPWETLARGLTVSVSIGVEYGGTQELSAMVSEADRGLYDAKRQGRGRVAGAVSQAGPA